MSDDEKFNALDSYDGERLCGGAGVCEQCINWDICPDVLPDSESVPEQAKEGVCQR